MLHRATITLTKCFDVDECDREFKDFLWKHNIDLSEGSGSANISERDLHALLKKMQGYDNAEHITVRFDVRNQ